MHDAESLREILETVFIFQYGYLDRKGSRSSEDMTAVVQFHATRGKEAQVPEELIECMEKNGLGDQVHSLWAADETLVLRRLSDGKEVSIKCRYVVTVAEKEDKKRFTDIGFEYFDVKNDNRVWAHYIGAEDFETVAGFLRESGVEFEEYTPPWLENRKGSGIRPSTRRAGRELEHLLGFG